MQVLSGSVSADGTAVVLDELRRALERGSSGYRLLVPTATMAEHLRNELAREGFVFSPGVIGTFSKFIGSQVQDLIPLGRTALELIVAELLETLRLPAVKDVSGLVGFRRAIVDMLEELSAAGGSAVHLLQPALEDAVLADFASICSAVEKEARKRGFVLRRQRLKVAADRIRANGLPGVEKILLTGFFSFTPGELEVIRALKERLDLLVTLPDWEGAAASLDAVQAMGAEITMLPDPLSLPARRVVMAAPSVEEEAAGIARQILEEKRPWREIGIIVRSEKPYVPVLRAALERFGIPARFYFGGPLGDQAPVRYLSGLVSAALSGWDYEQTLAVLRLDGSPLDDRFEYEVLEAMPGQGLEGLAKIAGQPGKVFFEKLRKLEPWRTSKANASQWRDRFLQLPSLYWQREIDPDPRTALLHRDRAAAITAFTAAVEEASALIPASERITCKSFQETLRLVIENSTMRVPDHRRNVVHVIDAYEARQWKLPVFFVCGLLEKQFPKHHPENPIVRDRVRRELRRAGVVLRTAEERSIEEKFLFQLAVTRATSRVVLSYPNRDSKGTPTLRSFFIDDLEVDEQVPVPDGRPEPELERRPAVVARIREDAMRDRLREAHAVIRPTAIDDYLQCPYLFHARHTLKLEDVPERPNARLNAMLQGSIAHAVLEKFFRNEEPLAVVFDEVFRAKCQEKRVPDSYRTEAIRLELFYNLLALTEDMRVRPGKDSEFERRFDFVLEDTKIRGQIDRIDYHEGRPVVIDYKYRSKSGIEKTVRSHEKGIGIQGLLYLLALRELGGQAPAGMLYGGFRTEVHYGGWVKAGVYGALKQSCEEELLSRRIDTARQIAADTVAAIRAGEIAPRPADLTKCAYCQFASMCRVEVESEKVTGA